ncbi:MAG: hypothetical protein R3E48_08665 [Burkholderiaceae bacterium]
MLRRRCGDGVANYFGKPSYDPDTAELRWNAEVQGEVRSWSSLSEQERASRAIDLVTIRSSLVGLIETLRKTESEGPGGEKRKAASPSDASGRDRLAFASLLEEAMKVPAEGDYLYLVGDQPVVAFWGFQTLEGRSVDPLAPVPRYAEGAPLVPAVGAAVDVDGPVDGPAPAAVAGVSRRKRPWWWWLLWLLLLILLLLLVSMLLPGGCSRLGAPTPAPSGTARLPQHQAKPSSVQRPDDVRPGESTDRVQVRPGGLGSADGSVSAGRDSGLVGRTDRGGSGQGVAVDPRGDAKDPGGAMGGNDSAHDAKMPPPVPKPDATDKDVAAVKPPGGADDKPPMAPAKPDAAKKQDAENPASPPQPPTPPNAAGDDGKPPMPDPARGAQPPGTQPPPMNLPKDPGRARDMRYLEGGWQPADTLMDPVSRQPLEMSLKFKEKGQGEIELRRADGTTCRGPVTGGMQGQKLRIEGAGAVPCSNGGSFAAPKIECERDAAGQTRCFGINPDGSRYLLDLVRR